MDMIAALLRHIYLQRRVILMTLLLFPMHLKNQGEHHQNSSNQRNIYLPRG